MRKILLFLIPLLFCAFISNAQFMNPDRNAALQLVSENRIALGLSADDLNNLTVSNSFLDKSVGIRYVYLQQAFKDIPVYNQIQVIAFKNNIPVSNAGGRIADMDKKVNLLSGMPSVTAESAVIAALADKNIIARERAVAISTKEDGRKMEFGKLGVARENITAQLMWFPSEDGSSLRLGWQVYFIPTTTSDYWLVKVDASSKNILGSDNLTVSCNWDDPKHVFDFGLNHNHVNDIPKESFGGNISFDFKTVNKVVTELKYSPTLADNGVYRVIPLPYEAPSFMPGAPSSAVVNNPWTAASANATTLKWHSTDATGTDYNYSRGNNVWAYEDRSGSPNTPLPTKSVTSTTPLPNLSFDFTPDYTQEPIVTTPPNQQFNITNLFYYNNIIHDVLYAYGFDEVGGNFQFNNLARGGVGNDHVLAEAQDGGGTNNANFATPADGGSGRMQMYLWTAPTPDRDGDVDNGIIAHEFGHGVSNRIVGGPANVNCMSNGESSGEGISDYIALMMTQDWSTANVNTGLVPRGIGTYALNQPTTGAGIRSQRYSTDFAINNKVYQNVLPGAVHDRGEHWCAAAWEMTWAVIQQAGTINPTIYYNGTSTAGNVVAMRLIIQGMKLVPCGPGFIDLRNGILQADTILYGGAYSCSIWEAFRKRGMGAFASQGLATSSSDQTPDFTAKSQVALSASAPTIPDGQNLTYTNAVSTCSRIAITNLLLTDTLPLNVTFVSATAGGTYNAGNRVVSWVVNQAASSTVNYQFTVTVGPGAFPGNVVMRSSLFDVPAGTRRFNVSQVITPITPVAAGCPTVTVQPANSTVCTNTLATFSVTASAANPITYQWQLSTTGAGGPWTPVPNAAPYSGIATATLTVNPAAIGLNNNQYRCFMTTIDCPVGTNSGAGILSVVAASIGGTVNPPATLICGTPNTGTLTLSGHTGNIVRWEVSTVGAGGPWTPVANTTTTLTYNNIAANTWYRAAVQVTGCVEVSSSVAALTFTVALPLSIVATPGSTLCAGDPALLTVYEGNLINANPAAPTAGGNGQALVTFNITNSNAFPATFSSITSRCLNSGAMNARIFYKVTPIAGAPGAISGANGWIQFGAGASTSTAGGVHTVLSGLLLVIPPGATYGIALEGLTAGNAANIAYTNGAGIVTYTNGGCTITTGGNVGYGGVAAPGAPGFNPRNYNGTVTLTGGSLTPVTTGTFLWTPATGLSSTTINPVAAAPAVTTTYSVTHNNGAGCIRQGSITITVNDRPAVTAQPASTSICNGSVATFTAAGTGTAVVYQWQLSTDGGLNYINLVNTAPYSGVNTPVLTVNPVTLAMNTYRYRLALSGTCPPVAYTNGAILTVKALPVVTITPAGPICGGVAGVNGVLLSTGSAAPPVPGAVTASSGPINLVVPDNTANGVSNNLTIAGVPANATITNVSVTLNNFSHTYPGDMIIHLRAPNNQILNLYKYGSGLFTGPASGVPTWGWYGAKVSQLGGTAWSTVAAAPFIYGAVPAWRADAINTPVAGPTVQNPTGFISAAPNFGALYTTGPSTNGTWTLAMCDGGAGDIGTLASWNITIDYTTPGGTGSPLTVTWSPATGLYTDVLATIPYVAGTQTPQVYAAPTALTVYTATGTDATTTCSNTATVVVNYTPPAPTVTPSSVTMCLGDPAVKLKSSSSVFTNLSFPSGTVNVAVPDNTATGASSTITVSGIPANATISSMAVRLNMSHTYPGDMIFNLKPPTGTSILNLYKYAGGAFTGPASGVPTWGWYNASASSAGTAAFNSVAVAPFIYGATPIWRADLLNTPVAGVVVQNPTGFVSNAASWNDIYAVPANNANGTWTLAMADGGPGDLGTLSSWTLEITYFIGVPATPAVWSPALGLFLDALASTAYVAGTAVDSVWAKPTTIGANPYTATVQSISPPPAVVTTPMAGGNGNNSVAFNVSNSNAVAMNLTGISTNTFGSGAIVASAFYKITPIAGNPGTINAANGWIQFGGPTAGNVTAGALNAVLTGLSLSIPAGATYGIVLSLTGATFPAYTNGAATTVTYTNNGCSIITGGNVGWGGPAAPGPMVNNPRNFNGAVYLSAANVAPCISPARTVVVTVNQPLTVTAQPAAQTICTDKVATFTVAVAGSGPYTYRWQVSTDGGNTYTNINNGGVYSGATSATLTITAPPVTMSGYYYRCSIQGALPCPAIFSFQRILTVNPLPTIVIGQAPYVVSLFPGLTYTINSTVSPSAADPNGGYTWLRNGVVVPNATTGSLNVDIDGLGSYQLRVRDVNGCTNISNTVIIKDSVSGKCFIYPNPNSGMFQVRYYSGPNNSGLPRTLTVFDAKGDRVLTQVYTIGRPYDRMDVDMRRNGKGLYWVEIGDRNGNRLSMCRIVIQ